MRVFFLQIKNLNVFPLIMVMLSATVCISILVIVVGIMWMGYKPEYEIFQSIDNLLSAMLGAVTMWIGQRVSAQFSNNRKTKPE